MINQKLLKKKRSIFIKNVQALIQKNSPIPLQLFDM